MLLVMAALEDGRRAGLIDSPPILDDALAMQVSGIQREASRPTQREVHHAVDLLAKEGLLMPDQQEGFVGVALAHLAYPAKQCALLDILYGGSPRFRRWLDGIGGYRTAKVSNVQLHHVWGGKTRINKPSNLLPLCAIVHEWVHTVEPIAGRLACVWARWTLPEFSWSELDQCAGLNVRGWVDAHVLEEPYRSMRAEILNTEVSSVGADEKDQRVYHHRRKHRGEGR